MAGTHIATSDPQAVKLWRRALWHETISESYFGMFMGKGQSSLCQIIDNTNKSKGDTIRISLRMNLSGDGRTEGEALEGNEEGLTFVNDDIIVNQLRHAVRVDGDESITAQRVTWDAKVEGKDALKDWWIERFDTSFFNQLCGYTPANSAKYKYTGLQAAVAPASTRILRPSSTANDQSLTSSHTFTLELIDYAKEMATQADPIIRPLRIKGKKYYVMFLHPYQVTDLRTASGDAQWLAIQKAAMMGGKITDNPIFTGALGMHNGVILHEADRITMGVNSGDASAPVTTARRAVLCGAQAMGVAFGNNNGPSRLTWKEDVFDYDQEIGFAAGSIFGMKKMVFDSKDFGSITLPTYAVAHS